MRAHLTGRAGAGRAFAFPPIIGTMLLLVLATPPPASSQQIPNLQTWPLPQAVDTLRAQGFQDIRVARWHIDDLPSGRVFQQFPPPDAAPAAIAPAGARTIWLIVSADPLEVPDFTGWRADHALTRIRAQGLVGRMDGPVELASQGEVIGQLPEPGLLDPLSPVALGTEAVGLRVQPLSEEGTAVDTVAIEIPVIDTVEVQVIDTVRVIETVLLVDTVTVAALDTLVVVETIVETETVEVAGSIMEHWRALLALGVGGVTLGTLGSAASARLRGPRLAGAELEEGLPPKGRLRGPALPPFTAVIVDEEVTVQRGRVVEEGSDGRPNPSTAEES